MGCGSSAGGSHADAEIRRLFVSLDGGRRGLARLRRSTCVCVSDMLCGPPLVTEVLMDGRLHTTQLIESYGSIGPTCAVGVVPLMRGGIERDDGDDGEICGGDHNPTIDVDSDDGSGDDSGDGSDNDSGDDSGGGGRGMGRTAALGKTAQVLRDALCLTTVLTFKEEDTRTPLSLDHSEERIRSTFCWRINEAIYSKEEWAFALFAQVKRARAAGPMAHTISGALVVWAKCKGSRFLVDGPSDSTERRCNP